MVTELPLEVLGRVSPILCWVEGVEGGRLPETWLAELPIGERISGWLRRELPTYSHDNIDEIAQYAGIPRTGGRPDRCSSRDGPRPRFRMTLPEGYDLMEAFRRLGRRYFDWTGNELAIRAGKMEELHELALRFPVRHLVRHRHSRAVAAGALKPEHALQLPEELGRLHSASWGLRAVIDRGLTEGHLHLWGVTSAEESWADHLLGPISPETLDGFSADEERLLALSRAAVRLLALGLLHHHFRLAPRALPFGLISALDRLYGARDRAEEARARRRLSHSLEESIEAAVRARSEAPAISSTQELGWILRLMTPASHRLMRSRLPSPSRRGGGEPSGIRRRLRLLERLHFEVQRILIETAPRLDDGAPKGRDAGGEKPSATALRRSFLAQGFYRYLTYNTHHWNLATQGGKTTGLREFKRFYGARQRHLVGAVGVEEHGLVLERLSRSASLRVVEGRLKPPERGADELVPWILGYADAARERKLEKFGIVIHFLKEEGDELPRGRGRRLDVRHGRIRRKIKSQATELYRLLSTPHPVVPFIVGIDAANLELTTPPEVFAPAFRFLREFPIELRHESAVRRHLGHYREIAELVHERRLGMTFHVGEDFRHLLSGLRAIGEVMEFLRPRPGDRLGHALALGLDPEIWTAQIGHQALVPRIEELDTMVWVYHLLGSGHPLLAELDFEGRIQSLSSEIYGERRTGDGSPTDLSPANLHAAWRLRQLDPEYVDEKELAQGSLKSLRRGRASRQQHRWVRLQERIQEELRERIRSPDAYRLLRRYWYDPAVRRRGRKLEALDMQGHGQLGSWLEVCSEVQTRLCHQVERKQLVVEVNPSSNRVIGPMARLGDHPIFRLTLDEHRKLKRQIRVTVNTDDPGVFSTSLAHEYYLLAEILQRRVPEAEVVEWLDWLRSNGEDYSFVRSLPSLEDGRMREVLRALRREYEPSMLPQLKGERRRLGRGRGGRRAPQAP